MSRFEVTLRKQGERAVMKVAGELELAVADELAVAIDGVDERTLVIDLSACEFIDSTGIAVILRAHGRFADEERRLLIASPRKQVLRLLEITGLIRDGLLVEAPEDVLT